MEPGSGLLSVGYGGRRPTEFVELLRRHDVQLLIDVRLSPMTRIPGFSKPRLSLSLAAVGIEYRHEPQLGNPPANRESFRTGELSLGRSRYRRILELEGSGALRDLVRSAASRRVAVLCAERNHERCHRQVIVEAALELRPSLHVVELA